MLPERLPDDAFDSVSTGRWPAVFLRDRQSKSGNALVILSAKHGKPFVPTARGFLEDARVRGGIKQPFVFLEPE